MWTLIKPLVHENTQKKIRILNRSATLKGLQEHIDISQIPEYYGGHLSYGSGNDSCRFNSPEQVAMNEYVSKLNNKQSPTNRGNISLPTDDSIDNIGDVIKSRDSPHTDSSRSPTRSNAIVHRNNITTPEMPSTLNRPSILSDQSTSVSLSSALSDTSGPNLNRNNVNQFEKHPLYSSKSFKGISIPRNDFIQRK